MSEAVIDRTEEFVGRLFEAGIGAFEYLTIYIGDRLGLYRAVEQAGSVTSGELAAAAGIAERYGREWLEQQAVAGILEVDDPAAESSARRYSLPAAHAEALTNLDSQASMAPFARTFVAAASIMPQLLEAYRTGGGVPWSAFGDDMIESQGDFNRPWLIEQFGQEFLPAIPDVHARLSADPPARVLDVACGVGWSAIAVAKAYPNVRVDGFDPDAQSIGIARGLAREAGLDDRVRFEVSDAAAIGSEGPYDLALVIEAVHDLARPVEILSAIHEALGPDGTLLVSDERVADEFTAPGDEMERVMYAVSLTVCLPASLSEEPSAATGTVLRSGRLREFATAAGFTDVEALPFEPGLQRFYRLTP
jgi:2-polyprenyl-3-methyl-5-hydroxy-6-metoxy-1,4-benzoquinol methylase